MVKVPEKEEKRGEGISLRLLGEEPVDPKREDS